jgi:hypothetical protein
MHTIFKEQLKIPTLECFRSVVPHKVGHKYTSFYQRSQVFCSKDPRQKIPIWPSPYVESGCGIGILVNYGLNIRSFPEEVKYSK